MRYCLGKIEVITQLATFIHQILINSISIKIQICQNQKNEPYRRELKQNKCLYLRTNLCYARGHTCVCMMGKGGLSTKKSNLTKIKNTILEQQKQMIREILKSLPLMWNWKLCLQLLNYELSISRGGLSISIAWIIIESVC